MVGQQTPHFRELQAPRLDYLTAREKYDQLERTLDAAETLDAVMKVVLDWDRAVRAQATWENLTDLRFQQDTRNEQAKRERDFLDEVRPKFTELNIRIKRKLISHPRRAELQSQLGSQAFSLWEADLLTFDSSIEEQLVRESKLGSEYTQLLASAKIEFQGESCNLAGLQKFRESPVRDVRYRANRAYWNWFAERSNTLDRIFADQVFVRNEMARQLGYKDFVGLGYKRMKRVDYNQADVERFRQGIREYVVPLCEELRKRQASRLGLDRVSFWDEPVQDLEGNPVPGGDHDWMLDRAQKMFDELGTEIGKFFSLMQSSELLDLKNREGKAGGGFCTDFPSYGLPFIFANFNGTKGDVEVFTHEIGHAFQSYMSRDKPLADYLFPTYESCEIHSMGLEFLTWPQMDKFFGKDGDRFRRTHLTQALLFLPYGVAVDHFQHLVYEQPNVTADDRHAMWQEMERRYLPWRQYGDLPHVSSGRFWHFQRHIFLMPFYYIDYALAQACALQLWARSNRDFSGTMKAYVALCRRGGEAPFQELAKSAGLTSPFESGCLSEVVDQARQFLGA